jgi:hypothetical protein
MKVRATKQSRHKAVDSSAQPGQAACEMMGHPVSKMKGSTFQCRPPRIHGQLTHTLGTKNKETDNPLGSLLEFVAYFCRFGGFFSFDCSPGARVPPSFFAHHSHHTSHIPPPCPFPSQPLHSKTGDYFTHSTSLSP